MLADRKADKPSGAFVALLVAVLAGGMVGLLVLNTAMQQAAFQLDQLRDRQQGLSVRSQVLGLQVERLRSPEHVARAATDLGMVQMPGPVFLRLEDGKVLGDPVPAAAGTGPQLVPPEPAPAVAEPPRTDSPAPSPTQGADGRPGRSGGDRG